MKTIDCEARVMPDGHLVLPPEVAEKIKVKPNAFETRRIIIFEKNGRSTNLSRFCGAWKDDRDADDIIDDIMAGRRKNLRSEEKCFQPNPFLWLTFPRVCGIGKE